MQRKLIALFILLCLPVSLFAIDQDLILNDFFWNKFVTLGLSKRPKIAVVLGGGGARGMAHIGVLKVFKEEKVPVDIVVGTSMGAIIGALYVADTPMDQIEGMGESAGWSKLTGIPKTSFLKLLLKQNLLSSEKIDAFLSKKLAGKRIEDLKIKYACVAADLFTGEKIIFRDGDLALAAKASSTIPGLFKPVEFRHRYLVDGGLVDNIPTDIAELMGADIIIAIAVSSDFSKNNISSVYSLLTQAIYIQGRVLDKERLEAAHFIIKPEVSEISTVDLSKYKECIRAGIIAAREAMPLIKSMLLEKTSDSFLFK